MRKNKWTGYEHFKRQLIHSLPANFKKIVMTIIASVFIGTIFGFVSLHLAKQDMKTAGPVTSNVEADKEDADNQTKGNQQLEAITIYMVQAGVFSDKANADAVTSSFRENQLPAISWEADGQYYVFTGAGNSEVRARELADQMKGFDVYVKEWNIKEKQITITDNEKEYLISFLTMWKQALENNTISEANLTQYEGKPETDIFITFYDSISQLKQQDDTNPQQWLLESIYAYKMLGE